MTTAAQCAGAALSWPAFTGAGGAALAGYRVLTGQACALDLR
jgi:hypothetical protein